MNKVLRGLAGGLLAASLWLGAAGCSNDAVTPACTPGAAGCQCKNGTTCDGALVCSSGVCMQMAPTNGLAVSDVNARGCEVLLNEGVAKVGSVVFDSSVIGTFVREPPRVAISFVAAKDAAIAPGAVQLAVTGDAKQVVVKKVSCVGLKAAPLAGVTVTLN